MTPPKEAPEVAPDVLLVPMLAFDPDGYRLGYGGGFYDRTLDKLRRQAANAGRRRPVAIGIAYAAQEMPDVPRGPYDYGRDAVGFQVPSCQTHGLVADRSERREDRAFDAVLTAQPQ